MIEVHGLTVTYGRTLALHEMNLQIRPGVTGLFGQNGAGKSTLLRVLAGLRRPSSGYVTIDGEVVDVRDETFRRFIAYSGHEIGLYRHLTVTENLQLFARMYGVSPSRIDEVLEGIGLADRAGSRVGQLSAGLARRASVARALLHEPRLLLLDEPYANLDDEASDKISTMLRAWSGGPGYAIVATHGAKRVKSFADGAIILKRGSVVSYRARIDAEVES
ncbi:MAG: heme ABC exporter ATP-binding protein CcmA [Actinomycetota bacterium]